MSFSPLLSGFFHLGFRQFDEMHLGVDVCGFILFGFTLLEAVGVYLSPHLGGEFQLSFLQITFFWAPSDTNIRPLKSVP